ncbi:MAG TPA: von Willebrand factor type A domain-containing protein [Gemmatimonadales bacterium]|nr:von Willebrand factor type A domain-containing protein [Gemmatimonadales bacterium]
MQNNLNPAVGSPRRTTTGRRIALFAAPIALLAAFVAVLSANSANQEEVTVTGYVRDAGGAALPNAVVTYRGSIFGRPGAAQLDSAGRYTLRLSAGAGDTVTIFARSLGFEPSQKEVVVSADSLVVNFVLVPSSVGLESAVPPVGSRRGAVAAELDLSSPRPFVLQEKVASFATSMAGAPPYAQHDTEEYSYISENAFRSVRSDPLSTFSIDVDRASYSNVRRFIMEQGTLPPVDAVRIEELVNYFPYSYDEPDDDSPVAVSAEVARAPWNADHLLVRVGLQAPRLHLEDLPPNNLVFLIDVSGSMFPPNKLPLLKQALAMLVNELGADDRIAIVVYAGNAGVVLPPTPVSNKERILGALEQLQAGGSTAGGEGIRLAYRLAREAHVKGGNNRVLLATDGDFNVGVSSTSELVRLVEEQREHGTFLTVLGFGMGNLKDSRLEQLADRGNGNYAYIDNVLEARKVLVQEIGGTLATVAKDVKLQLEFNPRYARAYRLIGYENRMLANADFDNDAKDAGEIGAGHSVTALYEVIPTGSRSTVTVNEPPELRYQTDRVAEESMGDGELLSLALRYKLPNENTSRLIRHVVRNEVAEPSVDLTFASAVAGFGMLLRESEHVGSWSFGAVLEAAESALGDDEDGYRRGFVEMVRRAAALGAIAADQGGVEVRDGAVGQGGTNH